MGRSSGPCGGRRLSSRPTTELSHQRLGVAGGELARIVVADIGPSRLAAFPQRRGVGSPHGQDRVGQPRRWTASTRSGRSPVTTTPWSLGPAACAASTVVAKAVGCLARRSPSRSTTSRAASCSRSEPVRAPSGPGTGRPPSWPTGWRRRRRPWSGRSTASASWPVVKNPPPSSSWNRSSRASAVSTARSVHTGSAGQLGQAGEAVDQPGVVGRRRPGGGPRPRAARTAATDRRRPPEVAPEELADGHGGVAPAGSPVAAAASARAEPYMAFHSVSTLSSRPGRTRWLRAARTAGAGPPRRRRRPPRGAPSGRCRMVGPRSCPPAITPNQSDGPLRAVVGVVRPRGRRPRSGVHT